MGWYHSAKDLLEAAQAVKEKVSDVGEGGMHSLAAVQAMLIGFAFECTLKGLWIKKTGGDGLIKNGKYRGIPGAKDHALAKLADVAKVELSNTQKTLLKRLSSFILFAGRYPMAKRPEDMRPKAVEGYETPISPNYIQPRDLAEAETLCRNLMSQIWPPAREKDGTGAPSPV